MTHNHTCGEPAPPPSLETLLDNLPGLVYRCRNDPRWTMEFVSAGCRELTGYDAEALLGEDASPCYAELILPEDRDRVWLEVQQGVSTEAPFEFTYRIRHADGGIRWVRERGRGVFGPGDELVALEGVILDVTDL